MSILILVALYVVPVIISVLFIRYDNELPDDGRKAVMGIMFIPLLNIGVAVTIIGLSIMNLFISDKLYNFIRHGKYTKIL